MTGPAELAAERYIAAWFEPDRARRAALLDACFAPDGRIVTLGQVIAGRDGLGAAIAAFQVDPRRLTATLTSAIETGAVTFRFRARFAFPAGALHSELIDIGEIDDAGRIAMLFTFVEPLADLDPAGSPAAAPAGAAPGSDAAALAAQRYVDACVERDPVARQARLEACFADDARLVGLGRPYAGRAAIVAMLQAAFADPRGLQIQRTSAIAAAGRAFRFASRGDFADASPAIFSEDVGEIDDTGRITTVYAFPGPLRARPA